MALVPGDGTVRLWAAPRPDLVVPSIRARLEGGRIIVSADGEVDAFVYDHESLEDSLAAWAGEVAARLQVPQLRPLPPVWCSWYGYRQQVSEEDIVSNLDLIGSLGLEVSVVLVDDGHEAEIGDWTERSDRFGSLSELGSRIQETGRSMGLWTAPFLVGAKSRIANDHPEWLVRGAAAGPHWDQDLYALDVRTGSPCRAELRRRSRSESKSA